MAAAGHLIERHELTRARELLEDLDSRYPRREEVLGGLIEVYHGLDDIVSLQSACQRLLSLAPENDEMWLLLAGCYLANEHPALALRTFRRLLERQPRDPRAEEIRQTIDALETGLTEIVAGLGLAGEGAFELAAIHEEMQCLLEEGEDDRACELAESLLRWRPGFLPASNNMSEAHFRQGRTNRAVAAARRVLELDPDNCHALSNLTRYLFLSGRAEEAEVWAERLKAAESEQDDAWLKKAEALSLLGDDEGVLETFRKAKKSGTRSNPSQEARLYHLAAVAAMRLGRERRARRLWKQAIHQQPGLGLARDNLRDLEKPVDERHGPWAYGICYWLPQNAVDNLISRLDRAGRGGEDKTVVREMRRHLEDHPELAALVPMLLDRGDPAGSEFALRVAALAKTPELMEALRQFAASQRGPDKLRLQATETLREAGLLPNEPFRMWLKGKWCDTLLFGFQIHDEPSCVHSPQVEQWACEAMVALRENDGEKAERLLSQALEFEPDAPDLLNNLATAYELLGRAEERERLVDELHRRYPDYFFGRVNVAFSDVQAGDTDHAKEMLQPLLSRQRLHVSEFAALCAAEIELHLAEGDLHGARSWLKMCEDVAPDHPNVKHSRRRLRRFGLSRLLPRRGPGN